MLLVVLSVTPSVYGTGVLHRLGSGNLCDGPSLRRRGRHALLKVAIKRPVCTVSIIKFFNTLTVL